MCHAGARQRGDKSGCGIYNPAGLRELFEIEMEMAANGGTVGIIGLGLMGSVMARRLMAAGLEVAGCDVRAEARDGLEAIGGRAVTSIGEIGRSCERVVIAVFDTGQVEDVFEGPGGLLSVPAGERATRVAINTATCEPDRIARLAERVVAKGLQFVELPISGTSQQVAQGDGVGLVAGEKAAAEAAGEVIEAICPRTYFMGAFGNGTRTKLAINHILGLNRAALAEGLVFAGRLGLPLDEFLEAAKGSAAYSQIMDVKGAKMIAKDFTPHGKIGQSAKDFGLIREAAKAQGQALPLADVYAALMEGCIAAGEAELDNAAVIAEIERRGEKGRA